MDSVEKRNKKSVQNSWDERIALVEDILKVMKEAHWLYSRFSDGVYVDVAGLCKIASVTDLEKSNEIDISIEEKNWSLTPGAYVGVAPVEDDGVDFEERMIEIHKELLALQIESNDLMDTISLNMKELGL